MLRTTDDLVCLIARGAIAVLIASRFLAGCGAPETATMGLGAPRLPDVDLGMFVASPPNEELEPAVQARDPRANWCEPLDQPFCTSQRDCSDGAECVRPWWAAVGTETKVCARQLPDRDERRWRADRLRVVVDHLCKRSDGCEPNDLHAYLRVLALRESTWRPWKRHRLNPDLEAAASAWKQLRETFAGNPAARDPDRWGSGVGLFGMNPARWLPRWDPMAPPETLCGEVEATEVHLRAARDQVRKIAGGVDCNGDGEPDYWGSSIATSSPGTRSRPSWYDVSRVNSGSLCPGSAVHRDAFEDRARAVGLDPWAPVTQRSLGRAIPVETQDDIAAALRVEMDALPR
jgi:hypothetical protein